MKTGAHDQTRISKLIMAQPHFSPAFYSEPILPEAELITPPAAPSTASHMSFNGAVVGDAVQGRAAAAAEAGEYFSAGPVKSTEAMREMMFRIAVMQPITPIDPEAVKAPKRRNVKISKEPQSVAARRRRKRISEKIRILQRLVPGGTKMDIASMLDEAVHYVKFLKKEVENLEQASVLVSNIRPPPPLPPLGGGLGGDGCGSYWSWGNNSRPSRTIG